MPYFDFSLQKKATKKRNKNPPSSQIIEKDVAGVVWVNSDATYHVKVFGKAYQFTNESFSCKDRRFVFHTFKDKNRYCLVRGIEDKGELDARYWRPFAAGCIVSGNLILIDNQELFDVKKIFIDLTDAESHEALEYYRRNYDEIKANFLNFINNGT